MVKSFTLEDKIDFIAPETVFNILFGNDEFTKRFHKKFNYDPDAEASDWDENNERVVKYVATTQAPRMIAKIAGDSFPVTEVQKYSKKGISYALTCNPVIESPMGSYTRTEVETQLSPDENGKGCTIIVKTIVECKGIWGLDGTIENFMECKAKATFDEWMTLAKLFCQEKLAFGGIDADERCLLLDENQDYFYDADDTSTSLSTMSPEVHMNGAIPPMQKTDQSRVANGILSRFRSVFSNTTDATPITDASSLQIYFQEMSDIENSCQSVRQHVKNLNAEMLQMDDNVKSMKEEILQIRDEIQGMRLAMEKKEQQVLISRRDGLTLAAGLATGFALGYAYMRVRSRS